MDATKLIYIANARIPTEKAHGLQIMKMCEAFVSQGWTTSLMLPRRFNKIKIDPFDYYGIKKNFGVVKVPCLDLIFFDKIFRSFGFVVESFTFLIFAKIHVVLTGFTGIIYTRDWFTGLFFKNFILEVHSLPDRMTKWHRLSFTKANKIFTLTNFLRQELIDFGISGSKIFVAPDGVDLEDFAINKSQEECRRTLEIPLQKKVVLYAGHLYKWKGVYTLLESVKLLSPDVLFLFLGGREADVQEFKKEVESRSLKNVVILGYKSHRLMPIYHKAADVLVLPNSGLEKISKFYTSPMKLFEYMASGVPIVASDLPSLREVLNEKNAVLVTPDNPQALAIGLNKILNDDVLKNQIVRTAFEDIKNYTWNKRVQLIQNKVLS